MINAVILGTGTGKKTNHGVTTTIVLIREQSSLEKLNTTPFITGFITLPRFYKDNSE